MQTYDEPINRDVAICLSRIADYANDLKQLWEDGCGDEVMLDHIADLRNELSRTKRLVLEHHIDLSAGEVSQGSLSMRSSGGSQLRPRYKQQTPTTTSHGCRLFFCPPPNSSSGSVGKQQRRDRPARCF